MPYIILNRDDTTVASISLDGSGTYYQIPRCRGGRSSVLVVDGEDVRLHAPNRTNERNYLFFMECPSTEQNGM